MKDAHKKWLVLHCIESQIIKRDNLDMVYEAGEPESESERRVSH